MAVICSPQAVGNNITITAELKRYMNLGCGHRSHPGWNDFDVRPAGPEVIATEFNLDTLPDGSAVKPDCLFMEAVAPGSPAA